MPLHSPAVLSSAAGIYLPDYLQEPNNLFGEEYCAGANASEMANGAFGWSDAHCSTVAPFMCKVTRKHPESACKMTAVFVK